MNLYSTIQLPLKMRLSVVVPAYNEEARIGKSIREIQDFCRKNCDSFEIIIVNDGSEDNTEKIAGRYVGKNIRLLKNPRNMGKGGAVKKGVMAAKEPFILVTDCDLSILLTEARKLFEQFNKGYDIVIASRKTKGARMLKRR